MLGADYRLIEGVNFILDGINNVEYEFKPVDYLQRFQRENDVSQLMQIYWQEMLYRSHLCAVSALKRNYDWIRALEKSDNNYILYCSAFRGLMESIGDTYDGLSQVAITLAIQNKVIKDAINSNLKEVATSQELEDLMINFSHASKKVNKLTNDNVFKPKKTYEYIKLLEESSKHKFYEYYETLCEVVHPASSSLGFNFTEENGRLKWHGEKDTEIIEYSIKNDKELFLELLMRGLNPVYLLLKTLNLLQFKPVYTERADKLNLNNIPAWKRVQDSFNL